MFNDTLRDELLDRPGCDELISPESGNGNNWTIVLRPWYRRLLFAQPRALRRLDNTEWIVCHKRGPKIHGAIPLSDSAFEDFAGNLYIAGCLSRARLILTARAHSQAPRITSLCRRGYNRWWCQPNWDVTAKTGHAGCLAPRRCATIISPFCFR